MIFVTMLIFLSRESLNHARYLVFALLISSLITLRGFADSFGGRAKYSIHKDVDHYILYNWSNGYLQM